MVPTVSGAIRTDLPLPLSSLEPVKAQYRRCLRRTCGGEKTRESIAWQRYLNSIGSGAATTNPCSANHGGITRIERWHVSEREPRSPYILRLAQSKPPRCCKTSQRRAFVTLELSVRAQRESPLPLPQLFWMACLVSRSGWPAEARILLDGGAGLITTLRVEV